MNNSRRLGWGVRHGLFGLSLVLALSMSAAAEAQPVKAPPAGSTGNTVATPAVAVPPAGGTAPATAVAQPTATQATSGSAASGAETKPGAAATTKPDPVAEGLAKQPGGMSMEEVAQLAVKYRPSIRSKQAELKAAAAKVDQAYVNYFPRLSVSFTYTRLSEVPGFQLGGGGGSQQQASNGGFLVSGGQGQVTADVCPGNQPGDGKPLCVSAPDPQDTTKAVPVVSSSDALPNALSAVFSQAFQIPNPPLDNYSFAASLAIPVSDYVFRISQGHAAASHQEKAKKVEVEAETLIVATDAKVAYLNWVRAKGQAIVAKEAVTQAKAHVDDVKRLKTVGLASQADVLRVDAQVASAEQAVIEIEAFAEIAQEQVKVGLNLPKDKTLSIGIDVMNVAPPASLPTLSEAQDKALERRLEIRALDETELSLKQVESATRAGLYPRLDAFADLTIANPNQRYQPATDTWNTTWDAGLRLSWTFNDTFQAVGAVAESKARVTQIEETKKQLRDGLRIEVAAAYAEIKKSGASIEAASRGLVASEEGLRVRRELYLQGKATNVEMLDSETEVTRGRLRKLDAQIGLLVAQIKFDHAIGNDVGTQKAPATDTSTPDESKNNTPDDGAAKKAETNVAKAAPGPLLPLAK